VNKPFASRNKSLSKKGRGVKFNAPALGGKDNEKEI
jgi:hypothetical protein